MTSLPFRPVRRREAGTPAYPSLALAAPKAAASRAAAPTWPARAATAARGSAAATGSPGTSWAPTSASTSQPAVTADAVIRVTRRRCDSTRARCSRDAATATTAPRTARTTSNSSAPAATVPVESLTTPYPSTSSDHPLTTSKGRPMLVVNARSRAALSAAMTTTIATTAARMRQAQRHGSSTRTPIARMLSTGIRSSARAEPDPISPGASGSTNSVSTDSAVAVVRRTVLIVAPGRGRARGMRPHP